MEFLKDGRVLWNDFLACSFLCGMNLSRIPQIVSPGF